MNHYEHMNILEQLTIKKKKTHQICNPWKLLKDIIDCQNGKVIS